jgi:hypothetical protein
MLFFPRTQKKGQRTQRSAAQHSTTGTGSVSVYRYWEVHLIVVDNLGEASVVGGAVSGGGVPAGEGGEASGALVAVVHGAIVDVVEALGVGVDERVEPAQGALAGGEAHVVQLGEDAGDHGAGRGGAGHTAEGAGLVGHAVGVGLASQGGHVGVAAAGGVVQAAVGQHASLTGDGEVVADGVRLPRGLLEHVGESTASAVPCAQEKEELTDEQTIK